MYRNPVLTSDSYKYSHFLQYPPGATEVSSYITARPGGMHDRVCFFGLQSFLKDFMMQRITMSDIAMAQKVVTEHGLTFNESGFDHIVRHHGGYWPVEIQALPEGMTVPVNTPLVQMRNTDPKLPWVTSFLETALLRAVWYPSTVATLSLRVKEILYAGLLASSDDPDGQIPFKLHDFGARGATSHEAAAVGGAAHLVHFKGTDTMEAIEHVLLHYPMNGTPSVKAEGIRAEMPGFSIPASEHSTMTSWGNNIESAESGEKRAFQNLVVTFGRMGGMVSIVSDSYDLKRAVSQYICRDLRDRILNSGATVVVRPDSGDPVETPIWVIKELMDNFGFSVNSKGYRVLHPSVRVIQGDGMDIEKIRDLQTAMLSQKLSMDNIVVGMGGGLLQKVNRDTLRFAMKANEIVVNDVAYPVYKSPKTDPSKASHGGRSVVLADETAGVYSMPENDYDISMGPNLLRTVYSNGMLFNRMSFDEVRKNANVWYEKGESEAA